MFDIRPVTQTGLVDFAKLASVAPILNLRLREIEAVSAPISIKRDSVVEPETILTKTENPIRKSEPAISVPASLAVADLRRELEAELAREQDYGLTLAALGGELHLPLRTTARKRTDISVTLEKVEPVKVAPIDKPSAVNIANQLSLRPQSLISSRSVVARATMAHVAPVRGASARFAYTPAAREVDSLLERNQRNQIASVPVVAQPVVAETKKPSKKKFWTGVGLALLVMGGLGWQLHPEQIQQQVMANGNQAVGNLEEAKVAIQQFDFAGASSKFALAYDDFSQAAGNLNLLGNSLTGFLADLPGLGKLKSANNLLKIGQNVSQAGAEISAALDGFYKTNFTAFLGFTGNHRPQPLTNLVANFNQALISAQTKLLDSEILLTDVDVSALPGDKQEKLIQLKNQLPLLKQFVGDAVDYSGFLLQALGESGPKKYLLLFQNNAELRPTGGFPGSYALIGFDRGILRELKVDDIYNIDGQANKNIIPPREMQHITPTWGMRDAGWWADFPTSAKKVMQFYTDINGGAAVDGVITLTPDIVAQMLTVTGPIELPEYKLTITADNFIDQIQSEVEYGDNRVQPKQVLMDLAPKLVAKIGQQDKDKWFQIFQMILHSIEQKKILAYFKDPNLEAVVIKNNLGGEVKTTDSDYLQVVHTNIKGSKTDAVIDTAYDLAIKPGEGNTWDHTLQITRVHNGNQYKYGFYNRNSYDFVRVMLPAGTILTNITGNDKLAYTPLIDYSIGEFAKDSDLVKYEGGSKLLPNGVRVFNENGKTVFGFWIQLEPGKSQTTTLQYQTLATVTKPDQLVLLWQKQSGMRDVKVNFALTPPSGRQLLYQYPDLQPEGDKIAGPAVLEHDVVFGVKWQ